MKAKLVAVALSLALTSVPGFASTKGCLAGAAIGGVGGHVAGHHALIGAAAGCAIGHYVSKKRGQRVADRHTGRSALAHSRRHGAHHRA